MFGFNVENSWWWPLPCAPGPEILHQHLQIGSDARIPAQDWGSALIKHQLAQSSQLE